MRKSYNSNIYDYDMFGTKIGLFYKGKQSNGTKIGTFLTIIYVICYFSYLLYFLSQVFRRKNEVLSTSTTKGEELPHAKVGKYDANFGFSLENPVTYDAMIDETIYNVKAIFKSGIRIQGKWIWEQKELELERCRTDKFSEKYNELLDRIPVGDLYCLKESNVELVGNFMLNNYSMIVIQFFACENRTDEYGKQIGTICKSKNEIEKILNGTFVTMYLQNININTKNYSHPAEPVFEDIYTTVSTRFFKEIHVYYKIVDIITDKGFMIENNQKERKVQFDKINDMISFKWVGDNEEENNNNGNTSNYNNSNKNVSSTLNKNKNMRSFCDISVKLSEMITVYKRSYNKIQYALYSTGGIMQVIAAAFTFLLLIPNNTRHELNIVNELFKFDATGATKQYKKKIVDYNMSPKSFGNWNKNDAVNDGESNDDNYNNDKEGDFDKNINTNNNDDLEHNNNNILNSKNEYQNDYQVEFNNYVNSRRNKINQLIYYNNKDILEFSDQINNLNQCDDRNIMENNKKTIQINFQNKEFVDNKNLNKDDNDVVATNKDICIDKDENNNHSNCNNIRNDKNINTINNSNNNNINNNINQNIYNTNNIINCPNHTPKIIIKSTTKNFITDSNIMIDDSIKKYSPESMYKTLNADSTKIINRIQSKINSSLASKRIRNQSLKKGNRFLISKISLSFFELCFWRICPSKVKRRDAIFFEQGTILFRENLDILKLFRTNFIIEKIVGIFNEINKNSKFYLTYDKPILELPYTEEELKIKQYEAFHMPRLVNTGNINNKNTKIENYNEMNPSRVTRKINLEKHLCGGKPFQYNYFTALNRINDINERKSRLGSFRKVNEYINVGSFRRISNSFNKKYQINNKNNSTLEEASKDAFF